MRAAAKVCPADRCATRSPGNAGLQDRWTHEFVLQHAWDRASLAVWVACAAPIGGSVPFNGTDSGASRPPDGTVNFCEAGQGITVTAFAGDGNRRCRYGSRLKHP
jgi:hypothetical protein